MPAACRQFLQQHPDARLLLVGRPEALGGLQHERARLVAASEVVVGLAIIVMIYRTRRSTSVDDANLLKL